MKLIHLNIWHGRLIDQVVAFLIAQQPDIVCLQEVYSTPEELNMPGPFKVLRGLQLIKTALPGYHCYFSPTYDVRLFNETTGSGNAVLSRYPLRDQETFFINGRHEEVSTFAIEDSMRYNNIRNLQRMRVNYASDKHFTLINHHGYWDKNALGNEHTLEKTEKVAAIVKQSSSPLIFSGDLNLSPASPAMQPLHELPLRNLTVESKIVTTLSVLHRSDDVVPCDYIFTSSDVRVDSFTMSDALVSDHKALILEFTI